MNGLINLQQALDLQIGATRCQTQILQIIAYLLNVSAGGKAIDVSALPAGLTEETVYQLLLNKDTGALLTQMADLFQTKDSVETLLGAGTKNLGLFNWRSTAITNGAGVNATIGETYVQSLTIVNPHSAAVFVKAYNLASVTPASDVPQEVYACPATDSRYIEFQRPLRFSSYLTFRSVTGSGDTNDTAPGTTTIVSMRFK